ncbi:MAG TPA: SDR family NAD(P)-dependent oxidoreductase [Chitinophagaceae bacterium]|jgi:NADP-dependent 3-hydroxy acid dehydrogenase YdfG|nr:SDR family NAD(P)-dependent oxidoreductase [Chitinophagaceae bacterium]
MQKIVFITGATSGFGKACAEKFAANGYDLILNGRREERLETLQQELEKKFNTAALLLPFDVRDEKAVFENIGSLPEEWQKIDVLINNAGLALGRGYFDEGDLEDWNTMIDTNVKGLMYVAKAVVPFMIKRKQGHIINMGSVAGKQVYEKGNVYCASKFAVDALNQAMRIDLLKHRIKVTAIHPGAAETEFSIVRFKGDETTAKKIYDGLVPLSAEDVAEVIWYCTTLPPHVCINDLSITCLQQADAVYFNRTT